MNISSTDIFNSANDEAANFSKLLEELTILPQLLLRYSFFKKESPMNQTNKINTTIIGSKKHRNLVTLSKCTLGRCSSSRQTKQQHRRQHPQQERQHEQKRSNPHSTFAFLLLLTIFLLQTADAAPHHHSQTQSQAQKQSAEENEPFNRFFIKRSKSNNAAKEYGGFGSRPLHEYALAHHTEKDGTVPLSRVDDDELSTPQLIGFDDAVFSSDQVGGMRPMLPDKWSNLFLTHQQRSFFPTAYGSGSGFGNGNAFSGFNDNRAFNGGMEKRRRGLDDTPQQHFVDNYVNLVEPGRLEWNFNRL